jgi:DNA-binding SARP family transcriptional activator
MMTVHTLGKFQITDGSVIVGEEELRSPMLSRLLIYLLLYRDKTVTTDDMTEAIWPDGEIDNPAGALKNLVYRLRKILSGHFGKQEYVLTSRGSYQWNPAVEVVLDIEQFEKLLSSAKLEGTPGQAAVWYEKAIDLYQGEFMPGLTELHWIFTLQTYYHSLYLSCVKGLASVYSGMELYEDLDRLSTDALRFESMDEELYCYQIEARMRSGKISLAMESYQKAQSIMEQELGIRKSTVLGKVYEELLAVSKGDSASPISEVKKDIEEEDPKGAFMCSYPIFKEIYHLEVRKSARSTQPENLVLFTFEPRPEDPPEVAGFRVHQTMEAMEDTIRNGLRAGDVVSRYSDTQFIVLLPTCTKELALLVAHRLLGHLYEKNEKYKKVNIKINVEEVSREGNLVEYGRGESYEKRRIASQCDGPAEADGERKDPLGHSVPDDRVQ